MIAYLPLHIIKDDLDDGQLVEVMRGWGMLTQPIRFIYPARHQPRRVLALLDDIAATLRLLP